MAQTGSGEAVMHALSHALGIAIARLDVQATIADASNYAEEARSRLGLDTEIMAAAMMIAQSLIMEDHLAWHASLTIGYSTGAKLLCDDRFFLSDICDYLTDAYTLDQLKAGEALAFEREKDRLAGAQQRVRVFRNELVQLLIANLSTIPDNIGTPPVEGFHVLIVDDSPIVRMLHQNLMRTISPVARVHAVDNVEAAVKYVDKMENCDTPVKLVLLDLNLDDLETAAGSAALLWCMSPENMANGLRVANGIDPLASDEPMFDMRWKPFTALISSCIDSPGHSRALRHRGCDVAMPKPLSAKALKVLCDAAA